MAVVLNPGCSAFPDALTESWAEARLVPPPFEFLRRDHPKRTLSQEVGWERLTESRPSSIRDVPLSWLYSVSAQRSVLAFAWMAVRGMTTSTAYPSS